MITEEAKYEQIIQGILANGYGICDNFLEATEVINISKSFSDRFNLGNFQPAGIGKTDSRSISEIRGDQILWLDETTENEAEKQILNKIKALSNYLNSTCYLGIVGSEFHYACYGPGKFYKRHKDAFQSQKGRLLSVIIYLNQHWQEADGGKLVIFPSEKGIEKEIFIEPTAGKLVCFESEKLEHEVQVSFAKRMSLTGWLLTK